MLYILTVLNTPSDMFSPIHVFCAHFIRSLQIIIISRFILNLQRTRLQAQAPTGPSGIRSSAFHIPTIADVVEDMGRPLDHGSSERVVEVQEDVDHGTPVAGPSFIRGNRMAEGTTLHSQTEGEAVDAVRRPVARHFVCELTYNRPTSSPPEGTAKYRFSIGSDRSR